MSVWADFISSIRIGIASAKANRMPIFVLQALAIGLVIAYNSFPEVRSTAESLAHWHRNWGWGAAFISQAVFCGVLPGMFLLVFCSIRPLHPVWTTLAQSIWCGCFGIINNEMFHLMARIWGDQANLSSVVVKSAFDQFFWTVLVLAPADAVFFFWLGRDFSFSRVKVEWPSHFFRKLVLPNLIPNWIIWIPVSLVVFSFPYALQIHVNGFMCTLWTLICLQIGRRTVKQ